MPQRKIILQTHELKKLRKESQEGSAHLFGEEYRSLNQVVKSTYKKIKTMKAEAFGGSMDEAGFESFKQGTMDGLGSISALKKLQSKEKQLA